MYAAAAEDGDDEEALVCEETLRNTKTNASKVADGCSWVYGVVGVYGSSSR